VRRPAAGAGAALAVLLAGSPALASYSSGAFGFFLVLYSIPVAVFAVFCTLFLWSQRLFTRPWIFFPYCAVFVGAMLILAGMAQRDPTSVLWVLVGDGVLLLPVLLPAIFQYARAGRG
jgi:hypothetical protein